MGKLEPPLVETDEGDGEGNGVGGGEGLRQIEDEARGSGLTGGDGCHWRLRNPGVKQGRTVAGWIEPELQQNGLKCGVLPACRSRTSRSRRRGRPCMGAATRARTPATVRRGPKRGA
ncbi:MAG: hypothetical protein D6781_12620 [Verrucomicrobia bacterium]|nr:MAG: hypothetical protein D6781_12620 [Verrucomicrobiota bacterium]